MSLHDPDDTRLIKRADLQKLFGGVSADFMRDLEERGLLDPVSFGPNKAKAHKFYRMSQAAPLLEHGVPAEPPAKPKIERALLLVTPR
jgi:hypothetical protein